MKKTTTNATPSTSSKAADETPNSFELTISKADEAKRDPFELTMDFSQYRLGFSEQKPSAAAIGDATSPKSNVGVLSAHTRQFEPSAPDYTVRTGSAPFWRASASSSGSSTSVSTTKPSEDQPKPVDITPSGPR